MPRCDASEYMLKVKVPNGLQGVVDQKDHKGEDARALLEVLISRKAEMEAVLVNDALDEIRLEDEPPGRRVVKSGEARWIAPVKGIPNGAFYFNNYLANTGEVADRLGVEARDVVKGIDTGLLTGVRSHTGHFRIVVKDRLHDLITKEALMENRIKEGKVKGRGLTAKILRTIEKGIIPSAGFSAEDVIEGLKKVGWEQHKDYAKTSLPSALKNLEYNKSIVIVRDGQFGVRLWSHADNAPTKIAGNVAPSIASKVAPSANAVRNMMDELVDKISDDMVTLVEKRTREKLGL